MAIGKKDKTILGLDIAADYIKIVELGLTSEGIKINSFSSAPAPPNSIKDGVIVNTAAVSKTLSDLLVKNNIQIKKVIASVRSPYALLRLSRLPFMSKGQAEVALQKEINQYTVFKGKEPIFDIHIIEEISEAGVRKMNILFAVATKELCNSYVKVAELAGLDLVSIDISPLTILRALSGTDLKVSGLEATMLVAINQESIDMCILKGESIRFCHTVKLDTSQMTTDIGGFVDKVASAFKLILNFYQAKYAGGELISKIVLSCDEASCLPLKEGLEKRLEGISIGIGNPVGDLVINENKIPADKVKELTSFVCAIGCALEAEGLSSYPVRFNLIPKERFERLEITKLMRLLNIILGGVLGIFFILATGLFINNKIFQYQIYKLQQQLGKPDPLLIKVNSIFKERDKIEARTENRLLFLNEISSSSIRWDKVSANAMAKVPEGLWLIRITSGADGLRINGRAYLEEPIFKFVKSLDNSFYFASAKLVSSQNIKVKDREELEFIIVCNLKTEK